MSSKNPSAKNFGEPKTVSPRVLQEAKQKNRELRRMAKILEARRNPDKFSIEMGTCWMCWMDLTGEKLLGEHRVEPYSEIKLHPKICPLCGYTHWKGRVWYPFRFLRGYIGNPSSRFGIKEKKKEWQRK